MYWKSEIITCLVLKRLGILPGTSAFMKRIRNCYFSGDHILLI